MIPAFARDLTRFGSRAALLAPGCTPVSYADLAARAAGLAARLPKTKRLVAIEAASDPRPIAAYLGALSAGHAVALLPPPTPSPRARGWRRGSSPT